MIDVGSIRSLMAGTLVLAFSLLGPPGQAQAQDETEELGGEEARALFIAGRAAFAAGRYEDAYQHFRSAYDIRPRDELLFNIGLAAEQTNRLQVALESLEKFLDALPESAQAPSARARIAELRQKLAELSAQQTPSPQRQQVEVVEQAPQPMQVPPQVVQPAPAPASAPAPAPAVQPAPPTSQPMRAASPLPMVVIIGGAVVVLGGLVSLGVGLANKNSVEQTTETRWDDVSGEASRAPVLFGLGLTLAVVGAVAVLGGVVWRAVDKRGATAELRLSPTGAMLAGRF